jgi:hypothetical protein
MIAALSKPHFLWCRSALRLVLLVAAIALSSSLRMTHKGRTRQRASKRQRQKDRQQQQHLFEKSGLEHKNTNK